MRQKLNFKTKIDCGYLQNFNKLGFTTDRILNLLAYSNGIVLSKPTLEQILNRGLSCTQVTN